MDKNNNSSLIAFIAGAAVGALAVVLLDSDMRDKAESKLLDAKTEAEKVRKNIEDTAVEKLAQAKEKIVENQTQREGEL